MPKLNPEAAKAVRSFLRKRLDRVRLSFDAREFEVRNLLCEVSANTSPEDVKTALDVLTELAVSAAITEINKAVAK
jgi:hypothetical protein